jgi:hypothetical protein
LRRKNPIGNFGGGHTVRDEENIWYNIKKGK